MKPFTQRFTRRFTSRAAWICAVLAFAGLALAQSVVKPTGNPARLPEADKKLAEQTKPPSSNWLLDANDDTERFRRLQVVASGTNVPMWEIGQRFEELHMAISKNNWEMGVYHLEKLRDRMNTAGMKRPARTQNIEGMFLKSGVYQNMHDALTANDNTRMKKEFNTMRQVYMACHMAENVVFLNDSVVFQRIGPFADKPQSVQRADATGPDRRAYSTGQPSLRRVTDSSAGGGGGGVFTPRLARTWRETSAIQRST
jgi:hypothetical protein